MRNTRTYSEQRQAAYFRAARDFWKIAAQTLDDVQNDVELASENTVRWAITTSAKSANIANDLAQSGHDECIASTRAVSDNVRARRIHSDAITAFNKRVNERGEVDLDDVLDQVQRERRERV